MLKFRLAMLVAVGLLVAQVAVADLVQNGSFETPVITWGTGDWITSDPSSNGGGHTLAEFGGVPGWTFSNGNVGLLSSSGTGLAGGMWTVVSNDPYVEARNGLDGYQCASWQSYNPGTMSQTLNVAADTSATLSFNASGYDASSLMQVTLDGNAVTFGGLSTIALNNTPSIFTTYSTNVLLTAGQHTLAFTAPSGVANIDLVSVNPVPEPTTVVLLSVGVMGLLAYAWRKRK